MILRFQNPDFLLGFLPILALLAYMLIARKRNPSWFSWRRFTTVALTLSLCVLGLARPQGGSRVTSQVGLSSNLFIAVDISRSMMAQDVTPSRIQFAVTLAQELLKKINGAKVALFPFALDGYMQMPLSADLFAASDLLSSLNPTITTQQGTDLTLALNSLFNQINQAENIVRERGGSWSSPQVLLLSDGESHHELNHDVLKKYRAKKIPIFAVSIGTEQGAEIPIHTETDTPRSLFKAQTTKLVRTQASPKTMREIGLESGGDSFQGRLENLPQIENRLKRAMEMGKLTTSFRIEREFFPYFFLFAFILFLMDFAFLKWEFAIRGILLAALIGSSLSHGETGIAAEKLATQTFNQGVEKLEKNDLPGAIESFQQSAYMSQNKVLQKKSLFNMGNALLKSGDPSQALQAYQQAFDTLTGEPSFDKETNQKISDNIVLAAKMEQQMQEEQEKQKGKGGEGDKPGKNSGEDTDPKGPKKFRAQDMTEDQKQKIYDLISTEERQGMQRVQESRNRNSPSTNQKPW